MAKKDRNKRAARKARQAERQRQEALAAQNAPQAEAKAPAKAQKAQAPAKAPKKNGKPGLVARARSYFGDVRSELHRVVWPSRQDLKNYTVAVIAILVVFGVAIWLIDSGVVAALIGYSGLRG